MRAVLILFNIKKINKEYLKDALIIGVDRGALIATKEGIKLDIAIGDFDSVNDMEFDLIKNNTKKLIKLNPIKDKTDTSEAIELAKDCDEILILGGIKGKRIEHFYANILELANNPKIKLIDDNSLIEAMDNNNYNVRLDYKYVSIFSILDSVLTLSGFKYNLENYHLKTNSALGVSNEIISNPKIDLKSGKLLIIYSNED